jgi:hypothetical protein
VAAPLFSFGFNFSLPLHSRPVFSVCCYSYSCPYLLVSLLR